MDEKKWRLAKLIGGILLVVAIAGYGLCRLLPVIPLSGTIKVLVIVTLFSGLVFLLLLVYLIIYKNIAIQKLYIICGMYFGMMFMLLIPTCTSPDEVAHFDSTYEVSNVLLGKGGGECKSMWKRKSDTGYNEHMINVTTYEKYYHKFNEETDAELVKVESEGAFGHGLAYLPGAVGITFARIFNLNYGWTTILGTMFQLISFVFIVAYAMSLMPIGKKTLFVVALLPMTLQQASSFSYDNMLIAMSILVISIFMQWAIGAENSRKDYIIHTIWLIVAGMVLLDTKGGLYALVLLLPMGILLKKICNNRKRTIIGISLLLVSLLLSILIIFYLGGGQKLKDFMLEFHYIEKRDVWAGSVWYYLSRPLESMSILMNTLLVSGKEYLFSMIGGLLGWLQIVISGKVIWPILAILVLSGVRTQQEDIQMKRAQRLSLLIVSLIECALCFIAMLLFWTPIFSNVIEGVQGRYFLPVLLAVILSVGYWKKPAILKIQSEGIFVFAMGILDYAILILILVGASVG